MNKNILLACDGSDIQQKEIIECCDLKNWPNAEITLLTFHFVDKFTLR
jgi:hypothetical protein